MNDGALRAKAQKNYRKHNGCYMLAACDTIMKEVNIAFISNQDVTTLVGEQQ